MNSPTIRIEKKSEMEMLLRVICLFKWISCLEIPKTDFTSFCFYYLQNPTGSYSVVDSDGFIRTVTYTADPKEGFKADVVREPTDIVVKVPTPAPDNLIRGHSQSQPQYASGQYRALPRPQAQQQQQPQAIRQQSQQQYQQYE